MCSPVPENSEPTGEPPPECGEQCFPDPAKAVVAAEAGPILYARFCLMNCIPSGDELGSFCTDIPSDLRRDAETEGGNGEDWAQFGNTSASVIPPLEQDPKGNPLEAPEREETQASDERAKEEAEASNAAEASVFEKAMALQAQVKLRETGAMVTQAQGLNAQAKAMEARASAAEVRSAGTLANSTEFLRTARRDANFANDAKAQLTGSAVAAAVYARNAKRSAVKAQAELQEIINAPMEAAKEAARLAVAELHRRRKEWSTETAAAATPAAAPSLEAANLAAAPYYDAMNRAMERRSALEQQARQLDREARDLQNTAKIASREAAVYQHAGKSQDARLMMDRSRELVQKSQMVSDESKADFALAKQVNGDLVAYEQVASYAAARATALAPYRWMPPPVPLPGGPAAATGPAPAPAPARGPASAPASLLQHRIPQSSEPPHWRSRSAVKVQRLKKP